MLIASVDIVVLGQEYVSVCEDIKRLFFLWNSNEPQLFSRLGCDKGTKAIWITTNQLVCATCGTEAPSHLLSRVFFVLRTPLLLLDLVPGNKVTCKSEGNDVHRTGKRKVQAIQCLPITHIRGLKKLFQGSPSAALLWLIESVFY